MKNFKHLIITILIFTSGLNLNSQGNLSIVITPGNPTIENNIKVKALAGFSTVSGYKTYELSWIDNNNLVVDIYCWVGMSSSPSSNIVYANIGNLPQGLYTVIANLKVNTSYQDFEDLSLYHKTNSDTIMFRVSETLNIEEDTKNDYGFSIYPNPTNNIITVEYSLKDKAVRELQITDVMGRIIATHNLKQNSTENNSITINLSDSPKGIYICTLKYENGMFSQKFIKH